MNLPLVPPDKAQHFIYGAVIAFVGVLIAVMALHKNQYALLCGAGLCAAFAFGKEAMDWYQNRKAGVKMHGVEFLDALATIAGGAFVLAPVYLMRM